MPIPGSTNWKHCVNQMSRSKIPSNGQSSHYATNANSGPALKEAVAKPQNNKTEKSKIKQPAKTNGFKAQSLFACPLFEQSCKYYTNETNPATMDAPSPN